MSACRATARSSSSSASALARPRLLLIYEDGTRRQYLFTVEAEGGGIEKTENIRIDFYFVEVSDTEEYGVGVTWPSSVGISDFAAEIDLTSGTLTSAPASLAAAPLPRIDLLQSSGWGRVARQASVITSNGQLAEFESGGEFNFAVEGSLTASVAKIPYGTVVKVMPRYDRESGRLELKVAAEVSSLADGGALPARQHSSVDTIVNVEMNQAVVLAGLYARSENKSKRGLPLISKIPVIGALFGRHGRPRR